MRRTRRRPLLLLGGGPTVAMHAAAAAFTGTPIVGVATANATEASARAAELGLTPLSVDDALARHTDDGIAVVSTSLDRRAHDALHLLDLGFGVAIEAPLASTLAGADLVVGAAERRPGRLLYAEHLAYAPVVQQMLSLVESIGRLGHLEVRALQQRSDADPVAALEHLGVHPLALVLLVANAAGEGVPVSVQATLTSDDAGSVDRHALVGLQFRSGLLARVEAGWNDEPGAHWDAQAASETGVVRAELLPVPQLEHNGEPVLLPSPKGPVPQIEQYGFVAQLLALMDAIERQRDPVLGATFGRVVLEVICAAYRSGGRDGTPVALPFVGDRGRTPVELWRGA
ncbi:MAG: hypothetical protein AB7L17_11375 [Ilumatobacteraceae bacterium]